VKQIRNESVLASASNPNSCSLTFFVLLLATHRLLKVACIVIIDFNKILSERKLNTSLKLKHSFIVFIFKELESILLV